MLILYMYSDINSMEPHKALQLRCYWASVKNTLSFYFKVAKRKDGELYYINPLGENEKEVEQVQRNVRYPEPHSFISSHGFGILFGILFFASVLVPSSFLM